MRTVKDGRECHDEWRLLADVRETDLHELWRAHY